MTSLDYMTGHKRIDPDKFRGSKLLPLNARLKVEEYEEALKE